MTTDVIEAVITVDKSAEFEHLEHLIEDANRTIYAALCVIQERELCKPRYKDFDHYREVEQRVSSLAWKWMNDKYEEEVE